MLIRANVLVRALYKFLIFSCPADYVLDYNHHVYHWEWLCEEQGLDAFRSFLKQRMHFFFFFFFFFKSPNEQRARGGGGGGGRALPDFFFFFFSLFSRPRAGLATV